MTVKNPHQIPIFSDQINLDIKCMKGVMFNIRFTYVNIVAATQNYFYC